MRGGASRLYSIFLRSVWQMPQASTRISSSPGPISGIGTDSTSTRDSPRYTAAFIVSELAVGKKLSQSFGGDTAVAIKARQTRHDRKGMQHRGEGDAGARETAIGVAVTVEIERHVFVRSIGNGADAIVVDAPLSGLCAHGGGLHFDGAGTGFGVQRALFRGGGCHAVDGMNHVRSAAHDVADAQRRIERAAESSADEAGHFHFLFECTSY